MSFSSIRETINLALYGNKNAVLWLFKTLRLLISLLAVGVLIYYYGFPVSAQTKTILFNIIEGSFGFYILHYLIKCLYTFDLSGFIKDTKWEAILMLILFCEGAFYAFFDTLLLENLLEGIGLLTMAHFSTLVIQCYLLIMIVYEISKSTPLLPFFKLHPSNIFILSFGLIIGFGTLLLMLPEMTTMKGSMGFINALFTSASATCVTGLIVVDTATFFTFKGQLVILILIKLGGLNIIAFGTFMALMAKFGVGVKYHSVVEDFVNRDSVLSSKSMLGKIIGWSCLIELVGAAAMYFLWNPNIHFSSEGNKIMHSIFHSVSAFNNAGLSMFSDGLYNESVRENYLVHLVVTVLVFVGALGMVTVFDIFSIEKLRERMRQPWRSITFSSKIALYYSVGLVVGGTILFYLLEMNNTIQDQTFVEGCITSLFQSVTRTSGFNTVDIGSMTMPTIILMMFLMFVGSSSSSTGGGIKTSTFAIISAAVVSTVKGSNNVELFKRNISYDLISKAFAVFLFFVLGNLICIFLLAYTEPDILAMTGRSIVDLMFEQVSAMGTVGLSTGITSHLSDSGKFIIMISMFVGRVGTLTVAYAFGLQVISTSYKYPDGHTMVG